MSNNNPEIVLDGDVSPFRQKLREAAADLKRFGDEGKGSFDRMLGPLGSLQSKFIQITALLAGGAMFKAAIDQSKAMTGEANALAKTFQISVEEASALNDALGDIYVTADDFIAGAQQLSRQLRANEADLNAMGLVTRQGPNKELRSMKDLMLDAIRVLATYKEGTDRNLAAQVLFGKGAADAAKLIKLHAEAIEDAKQKVVDFGLVVTQNNVQAMKEYKAAMDDAGDVTDGFKKSVGDALIPLLTQLAVMFASVGPYVVRFGRVTMETFAGIIDLAVLVGEAFLMVGRDIGAIAAAGGLALKGDFSGAMDVFRMRAADAANETQRLKDLWNGTGDSLLAKVRLQYQAGDSAPPPKPAGRQYVAPPDKTKDAADPSFMQYYEAALAEEKRLASEKDALREYTKEEELAYWKLLLDHAELSTKDRVSIEKKASDLTVAIRKQAAREQQDVDQENVRHTETMALARIDAAQAAADAALEAGSITQMQLLEMERQFELQRLEVQRAALEERLRMAEADPNLSPAERLRIQHQIEELEQQHRVRMISIQRKVSKESSMIWSSLGDSMSSLWDKGVNALMNGTFTWRNAFKAVGAELLQWFAGTVVGGMVKQYLAGLAKQIAAKLGFLSQEETAQTASSSVVASTKATEATAVSTANAVEAGTGAAASQASIPFVGPLLAIAAMGAIFAAVSAMGGRVKSASKGYSIPKGVNPMTQLHEEEMVLPAEHAAVIRRLASGEQSGGGGMVFSPQFSIQAFDSKDVQRSLKKGGALHKALLDMERRFVRQQ